jgi:hypothetical protein
MCSCVHVFVRYAARITQLIFSNSYLSQHTLHVDSYLSVDGSMWVDYRMGIESIWTGIGLPLMEMGAADRLDLDLASRRSIQELDKNMTALSQKEKR